MKRYISSSQVGERERERERGRERVEERQSTGGVEQSNSSTAGVKDIYTRE